MTITMFENERFVYIDPVSHEEFDIRFKGSEIDETDDLIYIYFAYPEGDSPNPMNEFTHPEFGSYGLILEAGSPYYYNATEREQMELEDFMDHMDCFGDDEIE
jgi:hypothetical protein